MNRLETNVLIGYVTHEDAAQAQKATKSTFTSDHKAAGLVTFTSL